MSPGLCDLDFHTLSTVTLPLKTYLTLPFGNRVNDKWYIFEVYLHLYQLSYLVITSKIGCVGMIITALQITKQLENLAYLTSTNQ